MSVTTIPCRFGYKAKSILSTQVNEVVAKLPTYFMHKGYNNPTDALDSPSQYAIDTGTLHPSTLDPCPMINVGIVLISWPELSF